MNSTPKPKSKRLSFRQRQAQGSKPLDSDEDVVDSDLDDLVSEIEGTCDLGELQVPMTPKGMPHRTDVYHQDPKRRKRDLAQLQIVLQNLEQHELEQRMKEGDARLADRLQAQENQLVFFGTPSSTSCSPRRRSSSNLDVMSTLGDDLVVSIIGFVGFSGRATDVNRRWAELSIRSQRARTVSAFKQVARIDTLDLASQVEECLFAACQSTGERYRAKARKLLCNLSDKKNCDLRTRLLRGLVAPYDLVRMDDNELARNEVVQQRIEWRRQGQELARRPREVYSVCELYMCEICGHERTHAMMMRRKMAVDRYRVLVLCLNCNHRWEA